MSEMADLLTIANVPLVETGIDYPVSTGKVTFTEEDLASIVESQGDPAIVAPRVKLGHDDPRFNGTLDGEPAFGTVQNLRLANAGNTVLGDLVGVPEWLAGILPTAYPNRSIEGCFDVQTATGHSWQFVMTDLALLGVIWPGISTLDDLQTTFSKDGPEGVTVAAKILAVSASTNMEDVRRAFYDEVATQENNRYWWWVRAVLLDPNELIADDDEGGLYRVPFSVSGDAITFDDPIPVKIEYVDAPVAASVLCGAAKTVLASYENGRDSRPATRQEEKVTIVTASVDLDNLRRVLGLPENATDDQINQALATRAVEQEQPPSAPSPDPAPVPEPTVPEPADPNAPSEPEPAPTNPSEPPQQPQQVEGAVTIDRTVLAQLQSDAQAGRQAFERNRLTDRNNFLHAAVQAGKFPPARLQHWADAWEKDPEGIKAQIDQMPAGLIPVGQLGVAPADVSANNQQYPKSWLPNHQRGQVTTEA